MSSSADVGGGQRVDGLEAPLTGRGSELRMVKELFHGTEESRRPRLVVLDGAAGIGKSRMAWEFEKYADGLTAPSWWHRGRCLSYGDGIAFWALSEAIRGRFGLVESDTGEVVLAHLDAGLAEYVADPDEREWLRPRLAVLLGAGSGATFVREDMFAAWTAFLEHLAEQGGIVVLVIDDAQHADDGLLDFLDHLLATARAPVFVLAVARPELLARRPDLGGRRATVVRLEPLDDSAMADLVDGLVVGLPASTRAALVERAEGVPLFAVETVRALIDRDLVIASGGEYVPADGADLDLAAIGAPASLQALVAARLDALTAEEKRVVTDASVLGATFTRDGLVALGCDDATLDVGAGLVGAQGDRGAAGRPVQRRARAVPVRAVGGPPGGLRHAGPARPQGPAPGRGRAPRSRSPTVATSSRCSSPSTCSTRWTRPRPATRTSRSSGARPATTSSAPPSGPAASAPPPRRCASSSRLSTSPPSPPTRLDFSSRLPRRPSTPATTRRPASTRPGPPTATTGSTTRSTRRTRRPLRQPP